MRNPEALAEFVRRRMNELNLSPHDVVRLSGVRVSVGTVRNLLNLRVRNIDTESLEALARPLQTSVDYLFELAYRLLPTTEASEELKLKIYYRNLPPERQKDVMLIVAALHREHAVKPVEQIKIEKRRKAA